MNLKQPIEIPVYEYTAEELAAVKAGVDSDVLGYSDFTMRKYLTIDSWWYNKRQKCMAFYSGGDSFLTPFTEEQLEELILNNLR